MAPCVLFFEYPTQTVGPWVVYIKISKQLLCSILAGCYMLFTVFPFCKFLHHIDTKSGKMEENIVPCFLIHPQKLV